MPPNTCDMDKEILSTVIADYKPEKAAERRHILAYRPMITFTYFHLASLYGIYLCFTTAKWASIGFAFLLYVAAELGITAAAHRLWSHKSFKAKMPLQVILMVFNTLAFQGTASYWVRDHRLHHKYCDTDGDPHNASRGFFYSHMGWLMARKSKKLIELGNKIDMSDIKSNPVLRFQDKYAGILISTICFILPTIVPVYFWGESLITAWHINILRYVFNLHVSFLTNSFCHMLGYRPYDKNILPSNNLIINLVALGDGFHNFHHAFPWDYQSAEIGNKYFNFTTWFIDFFAWIGWAYDLKTVSEDIVKRRRVRVGDGTNLWGWEDNEVMEKRLLVD